MPSYIRCQIFTMEKAWTHSYQGRVTNNPPIIAHIRQANTRHAHSNRPCRTIAVGFGGKQSEVETRVGRVIPGPRVYPCVYLPVFFAGYNSPRTLCDWLDTKSAKPCPRFSDTSGSPFLLALFQNVITQARCHQIGRNRSGLWTIWNHLQLPYEFAVERYLLEEEENHKSFGLMRSESAAQTNGEPSSYLPDSADIDVCPRRSIVWSDRVAFAVGLSLAINSILVNGVSFIVSLPFLGILVITGWLTPTIFIFVIEIVTAYSNADFGSDFLELFARALFSFPLSWILQYCFLRVNIHVTRAAIPRKLGPSH